MQDEIDNNNLAANTTQHGDSELSKDVSKDVRQDTRRDIDGDKDKQTLSELSLERNVQHPDMLDEVFQVQEEQKTADSSQEAFHSAQGDNKISAADESLRTDQKESENLEIASAPANAPNLEQSLENVSVTPSETDFQANLAVVERLDSKTVDQVESIEQIQAVELTELPSQEPLMKVEKNFDDQSVSLISESLSKELSLYQNNQTNQINETRSKQNPEEHEHVQELKFQQAVAIRDLPIDDDTLYQNENQSENDLYDDINQDSNDEDVHASSRSVENEEDLQTYPDGLSVSQEFEELNKATMAVEVDRSLNDADADADVDADADADADADDANVVQSVDAAAVIFSETEQMQTSHRATAAETENLKNIDSMNIIENVSRPDRSDDVGQNGDEDANVNVNANAIDDVVNEDQNNQANVFDISPPSKAQDMYEDEDALKPQPLSYKSMPLPASIGKDMKEPRQGQVRPNVFDKPNFYSSGESADSAPGSFSFNGSTPDNFGNRSEIRPNDFFSRPNAPRNPRDGQANRNFSSYRDARNSRDQRSSTGPRYPTLNTFAAAQAKAGLEALFSGRPEAPAVAENGGYSSFEKADQANQKNLTDPVVARKVVVNEDIGASQENPQSPQNLFNASSTEKYNSTLHLSAQKTLSDDVGAPTEAPAQNRTFLVSSGFERLDTASSRSMPLEDREAFDLDALALTRRKDQLPAGVNEVLQKTVDISSMRKRLEAMTAEQTIAWILATPEQNLKPFPHQEISALMIKNLHLIDSQAFHALHPVSYWICDPTTDILLYSDGKYRHKVKAESSCLPGDLGVWLSAHKLSSNESTKRSTNAQRINEISLAGIVMACNRLEAMQSMVGDRLDPLKVSARIGCAFEMQNKGHTLGEINGYALAMLAYSSHFFNWCIQLKSVLKNRASGRHGEISSALLLAIKTWSGSHGELSKQCAEMTAVMLQLGASLSEWGLLAFSPNARKDVSPSVAWARFCAQTFSIDPQGLSAQRVIDSAKINGFSLASVSEEPQSMAPYAQAGFDKAVAVFLRAGFNPNMTNALGQTVTDLARQSRSSKVMLLLRSHASGKALEKAQSEEFIVDDQAYDTAIIELERFKEIESQRALQDSNGKFFEPPLTELLEEKEFLKNLIASMVENSLQIRELDSLIGLENFN